MTLLDSILRTMDGEVKINPVFKLPSVFWSKSDINALLGYYGLEESVKRISADVFKEEYVRAMIDKIITGKDEYVKTSGVTDNDDA